MPAQVKAIPRIVPAAISAAPSRSLRPLPGNRDRAGWDCLLADNLRRGQFHALAAGARGLHVEISSKRGNFGFYQIDIDRFFDKQPSSCFIHSL